MSHVIHDGKLLESPFPHGSQREQMCFGGLPLQCDLFKFYKVIIGIKVIEVNKKYHSWY